MTLQPGARLGPYEVTDKLGEGGMGEVWRATDTNLKRSVAIKVLPESVAADRERLARFQREAEVLAALNHSNIAAIYGLEKSDGSTALVMELVEGPTLADLIASQTPEGESLGSSPRDSEVRPARGGGAPRGLSVDDALAIAKQIAEALEAAHEQGIIHRDLKPANVKVRDDGTVKVLDFGLAKAMEPAGASGSSSVSMSPTITTPAMTEMGMILGTAAYMSPEQAKGRSADRRSDIWAFGAVLYEMLTGRRAFQGEDVSETLADVMRVEPSWEHLPPGLSPSLVTYLKRCLRKNPKERIRDIGDVHLALEGAFETATATAPTVEGGVPWWRTGRVALLAGAALVVGAAMSAVAIGTGSVPAVPAPISRFPISPPVDLPLVTGGRSGVNIALSPDGTLVVYTTTSNGTPMLAVRRLSDVTARPIPGTEGGSQPFFSPDATQLGFVVDGKLRRMAVAGGPAVPICDLPGSATASFGPSWGDGDRIVFFATGPDNVQGLYLVAAVGGQPERITTAAEGHFHRWPHWLPGGHAVLYTVLPPGDLDQASLVVRSLETGEDVEVAPGGLHGRYVSTGHLVYGTADGLLMAVPFDATRLTVTGASVPMLDDVQVKGGGAVQADVAGNGSLVYTAGGPLGSQRSRLAWVTPDGRSTAEGGALENARYPALSPDGRSVALTIGPSGGGDIWIYDLATGTPPKRLTFSGHNIHAAWTPDGRRLVFSSRNTGLSFGSAYRVQMLQADGSQIEPTVVLPEGGALVSVHPDGQAMLFVPGVDASRDLWIAQLTGEPNAHAWLQTEFTETRPAISPDGEWVAYQSNSTDRAEIYVRSFPEAGAPVRVSFDGGAFPAWSRDGKALFFVEAGPPARIMSAAVLSSEPDIRFAPPTMFFEGDFEGPFFAVSPDGRLLVVQNANTSTSGDTPMQEMTLVLNWTEELKGLVPTD